MNNKIDSKKKCLKIVKTMTILFILLCIFSRVSMGVRYGLEYGMYKLPIFILISIYLLIAYYFSTKNIIGPIMGIVCVIYLLIDIGIPKSVEWIPILSIIITLLLFKGYVTLFIHNINDIKKSNRGCS